MNIPDTLRYTENHEWVKLEGNVATIGITDYAQSELGDIVYVDISTVGDTIKQGDVLGTIEALKTVSDVFAPLTGKVTAVNPNLENSPETVNGNPYGEGWIAKMEISSPDELNKLLTAEKYRKKIGI